MNKIDLYHILRIWGVNQRLALRFAFHFGDDGPRMTSNNRWEIARNEPSLRFVTP